MVRLVIWDAIAPIMTSPWRNSCCVLEISRLWLSSRWWSGASYIVWGISHFWALGEITTQNLRCLHTPFQWCNNERDGVSNHQRLDCLFSRLFRCLSKENINASRHWPLWGEIHRWPMDSPHKGPETRKMFPFDGVIMRLPRRMAGMWREQNPPTKFWM